ncbi:MAG: hypothetical protein DWQ36_06355 [Acidobacteria bacterium]|nr:MAG: hypothetical protein DWQ30_19360 [Acidobacteriota bacterium]REK09667.1 MAG: hypothetical protein DWQ36_06355 [Acidobacteriota bacterium]
MLGFAVVVLSAPGRLLSLDCPVPSGDHATVQEAVDDPTCTNITLSAQSYPESVMVARPVSLVGVGSSSSTLDGRLWIAESGIGTDVAVDGIGIRNGCPGPGLLVETGTVLQPIDVTVEQVALPCPQFSFEIFSDGFESGNTSAWSAVVTE